jgi:hypothetical protein
VGECSTVAELLEPEHRWSRRGGAFNVHRQRVEDFDPRARKFCLFSAIRRVYKPKGKNEFVRANNAACRAIGAKSVIGWSESKERTHEDVLELCRMVGI